MSHRAAVVLSGGGPISTRVATRLPLDRFVIAADSGLDGAVAMGIAVDLVVGDLDSVSPAALLAAERRGIAIERHPRDKDATDTELAVDAALQRGFGHIVMVGTAAGRLDHLLAGLLLITAPKLEAVRIEAWIGDTHVVPVRAGERVVVHGAAGAVLTLVPLHGDAVGVTTTGLRFPLDDETLGTATTRGVSNEFEGPVATVFVRSGILAVIVPSGGEA